MYFLIKDHAFTDGNKRTGSFMFSIMCDLNNLKPNYKHFTLDQLAVFIEQQKDEDHHEWIRVIAMALFGTLTEVG